MSEGNRNPDLFDPDEDISEEEMQQINKTAAAILDNDPEFLAWAEARHAEAVEAMECEGCCFLAIDGKVN